MTVEKYILVLLEKYPPRLTVAGLAGFLHVDVSTVRRMEKRGDLPARGIDNKFSLREVVTLQESGKKVKDPEAPALQRARKRNRDGFVFTNGW